jgi:hypothetical protein
LPKERDIGSVAGCREARNFEAQRNHLSKRSSFAQGWRRLGSIYGREHDAADRSRYPLAIDQDSSTPINFAESINFSPFQKIRTHQLFARIASSSSFLR